MAKRTESTEFKAGFLSGQLHDYNSGLCQDNIRKLEIGLNAEEPLIQAYWQGYQAGMSTVKR